MGIHVSTPIYVTTQAVPMPRERTLEASTSVTRVTSSIATTRDYTLDDLVSSRFMVAAVIGQGKTVSISSSRTRVVT